MNTFGKMWRYISFFLSIAILLLWHISVPASASSSGSTALNSQKEKLASLVEDETYEALDAPGAELLYLPLLSTKRDEKIRDILNAALYATLYKGDAATRKKRWLGLWGHALKPFGNTLNPVVLKALEDMLPTPQACPESYLVSEPDGSALPGTTQKLWFNVDVMSPPFSYLVEESADHSSSTPNATPRDSSPHRVQAGGFLIEVLQRSLLPYINNHLYKTSPVYTPLSLGWKSSRSPCDLDCIADNLFNGVADFFVGPAASELVSKAEKMPPSQTNERGTVSPHSDRPYAAGYLSSTCPIMMLGKFSLICNSAEVIQNNSSPPTRSYILPCTKPGALIGVIAANRVLLPSVKREILQAKLRVFRDTKQLLKAFTLGTINGVLVAPIVEYTIVQRTCLAWKKNNQIQELSSSLLPAEDGYTGERNLQSTEIVKGCFTAGQYGSNTIPVPFLTAKFPLNEPYVDSYFRDF